MHNVTRVLKKGVDFIKKIYKKGIFKRRIYFVKCDHSTKTKKTQNKNVEGSE